MNSQEIAYLILTFTLSATFIAVFFFTYVSGVEADIIKNQINGVITEFVQSSQLILSPDEKSKIGQLIIQNMAIPDMSQQDKEATDNNNRLIKKSMIIFGSILGIGILILLALYLMYKFNIGELLKYSFIILGLVMLTEIMFVTFVTKNYKLIDTNYIKYLLIKNLENYVKS